MARKPVSYLAGSMVLGTMVGVVVGMLTAPKSGREARRNLKNRAIDVSKQVPQQLGTLPRRGREALKRLTRREGPPEAGREDADPFRDS